MNNIRPVHTWSTANEIAAINYIASDEKRSGNRSIPSVEERKQKLETWLSTSYKRRWGHGVNVVKCQDQARKLLSLLH